MNCPGLHCPGCSGGQSLGILAGAVTIIVITDKTVPWVADRIFWIVGTLALCFALAVAASMWLGRLTERREAAFAAAHGILSRADGIAPLPAPAQHRAVVLEPERRAIAPAPQVVVNIFGMNSPAQAAELIRQALPGSAGELTPEEELWSPPSS